MMSDEVGNDVGEELFAECLELGICAQCSKNSEFIFLYPPNCDHRLCIKCTQNLPPECPTCKKPFNKKYLTPDLCFKAIWDNFTNELDEATFSRLVQESETKALAAKSRAESTHSLASSANGTCTKVSDKKKRRRRGRLPKGPAPSSSKATPGPSSTPRTPQASSVSLRDADQSATTAPPNNPCSTPSPSTSFGKSKRLKRNAKGETLLHQYCSEGFAGRTGFSLSKLEKMLAEGANPNTMDASGITPLHECIVYDNVEIMQVLLDGGALVNSYSDPPCTPLHAVVEKFIQSGLEDLPLDSIAYKIITTLLDYGADMSLRDRFRRTPSDIAKGHHAVLHLLKVYRPNIVQRSVLLAPEPPMVVMSSTNDSLQRFGNQFKVEVIPEHRGFKPTVTHLVVPDGTKSANFLIRMAILSGCYVITMQWVKDCLAQDRLLPAVDYELRDPLVPNSRTEYVTRKARMDRLHMQPKLFAAGQFHVLPPNISDRLRSEIVELVKAGGGAIFTREPKPSDFGDEEPKLIHAEEGSRWERCSVFILYAREPRALFQMPHIKHVPLTWFLDCIDTYSIREQ